MRCEIFPVRSFDSLEKDWSSLAQAYWQAPFLGVDFVRTLIEVFATGQEQVVRVTTPGGEVVAMGIFARRGTMWETFQPSQLPIGCLVVQPRTDWESLLQALGRALPGLSLGVAASQQDPLSTPRPRSEGRISTLDYIETPFIDITGSFTDYWEARGKNLRQNLRKQRRKLADEGTELTLDVVRSPQDVAQAVEDYAKLESAGWKAGGGTAVTSGNAQARFYQRVLERYCEKGKGRIYRYRFNDHVVVVDLCIESNDSLVVLKTTYDESIRSYSPAALMREDAFKALWEEGVFRRIEFFGPKKEWHTRWTEQSRVLYHVNWYRWPSIVQFASRLARALRPEPTPDPNVHA